MSDDAFRSVWRETVETYEPVYRSSWDEPGVIPEAGPVRVPRELWDAYEQTWLAYRAAEEALSEAFKAGDSA